MVPVMRNSWSIDITNTIKGFAILMIVVGHVGLRIPGARILAPFGAIGVGLFLICSGYGLGKSYGKNGLSNYWPKKFYNVYLPWISIEVIGIFFHPQVSMSDIMLDLLLIRPLHPFGWYLQFLLIWYVAFYVVKLVFRNQWGGQIISLLTIACITVIFWDSTQAQNSLSFLTGVMLSKIDRWLGWLTRKSSICILAVVLMPLAYIRVARLLDDCNPIVWNIYSLAYYYSFTLVVLSTMLQISELKAIQCLSVLGIYSYSIYLVHGYTFVYFNSPTLVSMASFLCATIIGTYVFQYYISLFKFK